MKAKEDFMFYGESAGFTEEQLQFMWDFLALSNHEHSQYRIKYQ